MKKEIMNEISLSLRYFFIALMAELAAGAALLPNQKGNDVNIAGYFELEMLPHLLAWFIAFVLLCAIWVTILLLRSPRKH